MLYGYLKRRKKGTEVILEEMMTTHFPNLGRTMNVRIEQNQYNPNSINSKENHTKTHYSQTAERQR